EETARCRACDGKAINRPCCIPRGHRAAFLCHLTSLDDAAGRAHRLAWPGTLLACRSNDRPTCHALEAWDAWEPEGPTTQEDSRAPSAGVVERFRQCRGHAWLLVQRPRF